MNQELINKEKKQLLLFSKFKKIGILCLSIGGGLVALSFLLLVIFIIAGSRYMADMNVEEGESKNEKD